MTKTHSIHGHTIMAEYDSGVLMTPLGGRPKGKYPEGFSDIRSNKWVNWGEDNLFPQNIVAATEKSTIIAPAIDKQIRYSYAGGIQAGRRVIVDNQEIFVPEIYQPFEEFKRKSNLNAYLLEGFSDLYWFVNLFPNFILSRDRTKIVQLFIEEACYCRWGWPDIKTGLTSKCYISANWEKGTPSDSQISEVDVLDPYFDVEQQLRDSKAYRFVYPVSYPSPNKHYYQLAPWNGAISSGWLAFSLQIPKFKESMMKNQLSLKYHLQVNEEYWPSLFSGWDKMTDSEKEQSKASFLLEFTKRMTSPENANKTLMTQFFYSKTGEERVAWKVTAIDDKIKTGIYVEDSQEASTHLMNAMGLDPTLFGSGPGKGFSAGSGSDKNSAYNLYMASIKPHHDLILAPLYVVRDYNGWDPGIEFRLATTFMSASTSGKPTMQPANG
jgi:hypothetical protein